MIDIFETPVHDQRGRYNSPAHESFRAVCRSMLVHYGDAGSRRIKDLLKFMGVRYPSELSPDGVYHCRKIIERQLPIRGDYAS